MKWEKCLVEYTARKTHETKGKRKGFIEEEIKKLIPFLSLKQVSKERKQS